MLQQNRNQKPMDEVERSFFLTSTSSRLLMYVEPGTVTEWIKPVVDVIRVYVAEGVSVEVFDKAVKDVVGRKGSSRHRGFEMYIFA